MTDNNIIYQARLHWVLFFWPIALFLIACYLAMKLTSLHTVATFFAIFSLIWGFMTWMTYESSSLIIKKKQLVLRTGILVRETVDIPLNKIESIDIRQSLLGSLLHYGSLVITGTGGSRKFINYLSRPLTCRRYIEQLLHE